MEDAFAAALPQTAVANAVALHISLPIDRVEIVVGRVGGRRPLQITWKKRKKPDIEFILKFNLFVWLCV